MAGGEKFQIVCVSREGFSISCEVVGDGKMPWHETQLPSAQLSSDYTDR